MIERDKKEELETSDLLLRIAGERIGMIKRDKLETLSLIIKISRDFDHVLMTKKNHDKALKLLDAYWDSL